MNGVTSIAQSIKNALGFETSASPSSQRPKVHEKKTNFDKIVHTSTSYDNIDVTLYKSRETGLKVLIANVEVPIVCLVLFLV